MITPRIALWSTAICLLAPLTALAASPEQASVEIAADKPGPVISREIYGQFTEHLGHCIYGGIWVGEDSKIPNTRGIRNDVVEALKKLNMPTVRWPGGCFADTYHWKDGVGPRKLRPSIINSNWGGVLEDNSFGTHEFMDFCEQVGTQPYISGNLGSGTVQEMADWVEYMTSDLSSPMANLRRANGRDKPWKVPFLGMGNEAWGCGGNMNVEFYCDNFRRYSTFVKDYAGGHVQRVASGPSADDYHWTEVCMDRIGGMVDALSLHYYTIPTGDWGRKGSAVGFPEKEWISTLKQTLFMDEMLTKHSAIMDKKDPQKKIGLYVDEWGTWYDNAPGTNPGFLVQQNTMRDAIVAGLNLNIFHAHADRVRMACIAQMVNVLQAMVMTDGPRMCVTPTYHVFEMYKVHQNATSLPVKITGPAYSFDGVSVPAVSASASRDAKGVVHVSLVNVDPKNSVEVATTFEGAKFKSVSGRILTAATMDAHNSFEQPDAVHPVAFTGAKVEGSKLTATLPPMSVVVLELQ